MTAAGSADESSLIARTKSGDNTAFQILLHRYLPMINSYAVRMLGNQADAADICQEVFIRFWQKSDTFDPGRAKLSTWLHQIAHNLCIDHFRKHRNTTFADDEEVAEGESQIEPEQSQSEIEDGLKVKHAISQLPERQRSALLFCHYQGLSNKQAADILDVSVDALESLLARARRSLRLRLEEQTHG